MRDNEDKRQTCLKRREIKVSLEVPLKLKVEALSWN